MEDEYKKKSSYPNLKVNGRLFPIWILKNFSKYKLPEIIRKSDEDPCNMGVKMELRKYQEFIAHYLDYNSPFHDILIYHGLGSGKTANAINIYNVLYNASSGWNVYILVKASLVDVPWKKDLDTWLSDKDKKHRFANIHFIHYDSPFANKAFMDEIKKSDSSKKNMYIIDEVHNFIINVYSNLSSQKGKRAIEIYNHIIEDKIENPTTRTILISGTPVINQPFELGLLFNLLRPGSFPKTKREFDQYFVDVSSGVPILNPQTKNMFQRRILGLVSYYIGGTPDLFASSTTHNVEVPMSQYQTEMYDYFEKLEKSMTKKTKGKKSNDTYAVYTRQSSNFVFPFIDENVNGEDRPRPGKFRISEIELEKIMKTNDLKKIKEAQSGPQKQYFAKIKEYLITLSKYFESMYSKKEIDKDIENFKKYDNYKDYFEKEHDKSKLIKEMMKCSGKYINIIFNIFKSNGPVLIYTNYVLMEGIDVLKIYLGFFGFKSFLDEDSQDYFRYGEYHNNISTENRQKGVKSEVKKENIDGKNIKIMLFSPAGSEGVSLANIRQVHIIEPYWHEIRIIQMIGRANRQCSHRNLPMADRHIDIYRYKSVKSNVKIITIEKDQIVTKKKIFIEDFDSLKTIDFVIERLAKNKNDLIQSFLMPVKESAVDCELFKNHNMMGQKYKCFKFDENSLFDKNIGPAYANDIIQDIKLSNGTNSINSITVKTKVFKINGIINTDNPKKDKIENFWHNPENGVVYDYDTQYPVGKIEFDENDIPIKLDKFTYVIDAINIPVIET
jgi:hypothetical protein